jgi:hypothetical protein
MFPDEARSYRISVFAESLDPHGSSWFNGEQYPFSKECLRRAWAVQDALLDLGEYLNLNLWWFDATELKVFLMAFDTAWAHFEYQFNAELISYETSARQPVADVISQEQRLQLIVDALANEDRFCGLECHYNTELRHLVEHIAKLNEVANERCKGRGDLSVEIFFAAQKVLDRRVGDEESSEGAWMLAANVVESFQALRDYLKTMSECLDQVNPDLCCNPGLVARLVEWEESWEMGAKYVQHEPLFRAVCDVVDVVHAAQNIAPVLIGMCSDYDVELFMVLPRIIWLRFLAAPTRVIEFLKTFLPHHFEQGDHSACPWDADLAALIEKFRCVDAAFSESTSQPSHLLAWDVLVSRVVSGDEGEEIFGDMSPEIRSAFDDLLRDVEGYSIELQRQCPEDWNQCSAILVQCLTDLRTER